MVQVDVFIPVYNDVRFVPAAVESVLKQTGVDVRVIVSDNASTDGTSEWLAAAAQKDPRLVVHRNDANIGLVGNLNRFRDVVEAPYYMLLCSDDVLYEPSALAKAAAVVAADPSIVSVYCDLAYIDAHHRVIARRRFGRAGVFSADDAFLASQRTYRNMFGIPLLNKTEVHRQLAYPEGLTYAGDVYLSMAAARHGTVAHIPEILIGNRYTGGNMTASVMHESIAQFAKLAQLFGVVLGPLDRLRQKINFPLVMLSKRLFLTYARLRK